MLATGGIAGSVHRADSVQQEVSLRYGLPSDGTWVRCSDLLAGPPLADWAGRITAWLLREYGEAPERTVTGYQLSWYLTVPAQVGALLFHTERRVPRLSPAALAVRFGPDHPRPDAIAVLDPRFACLAGDPEADLPTATPVTGLSALADLLRARYAAHAAAFLAAMGGRTRLGRRTLWGSATDALDGACWRIGQYCGDEAAGAANAALVLPAAQEPFTSASTLRPAEAPAGGWTRRRDSCCFHYVLAAGMGPCETCPRVRSR